MALMLATDICRRILREQPVDLLAQLQQWSGESREIIVSAITYAELVAAALLTAERDRHMALVDAFCARLDAVAPWDGEAVAEYTSLQRELLRQQRALHMNDVMTAAHARSLDAVLLCRSERAFADLPGLRLQVWADQ